MRVNKFIGAAALTLMLIPDVGRAQRKIFTLDEASFGLPRLSGKSVNREYPYVTAGDRLYSIGDQAGGFPAIGFHVEGQMGGVWQQPIKLLNGYVLGVKESSGPAMVGGPGSEAGDGSGAGGAGDGERRLDYCDSFSMGSFMPRFVYGLPGMQVVRSEFVPDGLPVLVVEYVFTNKTAKARELELVLHADVNLMPVWLGERSGMIDSTDQVQGWDAAERMLYFKDAGNPWYAGIGFEQPDAAGAGNGAGGQGSGKLAGFRYAGTEKSAYHGKGIGGLVTRKLQVPAGGKAVFRFYVSGSEKNRGEIAINMNKVRKGLPALFAAKRDRYLELASTAAIRIPDKQLELAYQWGKFSSDWLVRDVPGLGRGMSAGLPDYPWFFSNDQAYTFKALAGTVRPEIFYRSFAMLQHLSDSVNEGSGRIIHEASTNGSVYDKGRMEESQLFILAAWHIYKWTGNKEFLRRYYEHGGRVWKWLQQHDTDHNSYIEGYGGVEIEGLNAEMLDVQVRTADFLRVMGEMASVLGDAAVSADYRSKGEALVRKINADWWMPSEQRYADFISSREKAVTIIDSALAKRTSMERNSWAVKKLQDLRSRILSGQYTDKGYTVYYNTAGILPLEDGIAEPEQARQMLAGIGWFTNKFGLYITGIERPDDVRIDEGSFRKDREFNYGRAVMPAATASLVTAACRYAGPDTALIYIHKILNSFGYATPGTTYEVSPDYGMFVQAWNIRGLNIPLIQYFFGFNPMAADKRLVLRPDMPSGWEYADIRNVLVGDARWSVGYSRKGTEFSYRVKVSEAGWVVDFQLPAGAKNVRVNGKPVDVKEGAVTLRGTGNVVNFTK